VQLISLCFSSISFKGINIDLYIYFRIMNSNDENLESDERKLNVESLILVFDYLLDEEEEEQQIDDNEVESEVEHDDGSEQENNQHDDEDVQTTPVNNEEEEEEEEEADPRGIVGENKSYENLTIRGRSYVLF
jgi:hypothetical protein